MAKSYGFSSLNTNLMATPVWRCAGLFITTFLSAGSYAYFLVAVATPQPLY
jgi:hypothetical protein